MALYITNDCINCNACADECPVNAVYPGSILRESNEDVIPPDEINHCFIAPDKCTECEDVSDEPKCIIICPMNCIEYAG